MAKTRTQLEEERRQRLEERRKILMEFPEVYQRDFDKALQGYVQREFPELDPHDCDVLFDPDLREGFLTKWPEEAQELSRQYNLVPVWDPDGDELPEPVEYGAARVIRCQDDRIWAKQITPGSIINLPPHKVLGRFLLVEIDLSKPRREIAASVMAIVDQKKRRPHILGSHHELVRGHEPRNTSARHTFHKMTVWQMVEQGRRTPEEDEREILWRIAKAKTIETADTGDERKWLNEERRHYEALKSAFFRDKKIYFGEFICLSNK
jgi:hypothetical protein